MCKGQKDGGEATCGDTRTMAMARTGDIGGLSGSSTTAEPPRIVPQVKVYSEPGRFAGWPANHGMWIDA